MDSWTRNQVALRQHLDRDDIRHFLRWSTIQATMYVGNAPYIKRELDALRPFAYWQPAVFWDRQGPSLIGESDTNLIHQAYHLKQWRDKRPLDMSQLKTIVEFGAGYGAMALICRRLGFTGSYHIIDLPEMERLQRHYLWETLGNLDGFYWELPGQQADLFIGCFSLCEVSIKEREKLLSQVAARDYLFASSYEFDGVDNQTWFTQLGGTIGYDWVQYPNEFQENCFYQVGTGL